MQTKKGSLTEAITNVLIGYFVALGSQLLIFPFFGIDLPLKSNIFIGLWFTLISIIRSYMVRRVYNRYNFFSK